MMRSRNLFFTAAILVLTLVSLSSAAGAAEEMKQPRTAEPSKSQHAAGEGAAVLQRTAGEVAAVDERKNLLKVKAGLIPMKFTIEHNTVITKGDQRLRLGQLKTGDEVTVGYVKREGKNIARSIEAKNEQTRG